MQNEQILNWPLSIQINTPDADSRSLPPSSSSSLFEVVVRTILNPMPRNMANHTPLIWFRTILLGDLPIPGVRVLVLCSRSRRVDEPVQDFCQGGWGAWTYGCRWKPATWPWKKTCGSSGSTFIAWLLSSRYRNLLYLRALGWHFFLPPLYSSC